jgi:hypothetical protein
MVVVFGFTLLKHCDRTDFVHCGKLSMLAMGPPHLGQTGWDSLISSNSSRQLSYALLEL